MNDTFANLVDGSGAVSANMAKIDDKDADVAVTVSDTIGTASAQNVTDLNALLGATTGTVTATINGDYAELSSITTTATDAGTSTLTITVNDAVTAAQGNTALGLTDGTVIYGGGVSDTFANLVDGSGAVSTNMGNIDNADADVAVTVSDTIGTASAQNVTDLNALLGATTGTVTATINGSAANLDDIASSATDVGTSTLTITVNDALSGSAGVTAINKILAASDAGVTATISGNYSDLANITATASDTGDSSLAITVDDVVNASQANTVTGLTDNSSVTFGAGISDTLDNLSSGGSAVTNLTNATTKDTDVIVTISDANGTAVNASDLSAVGSSTTGTVTVSNAVNISGTQSEVTAALVTSGSKVTASTANVTVTTAVTVAQGAAIADATSGTVTFNGGISDTLSNLVSSGAITTNFDKIIDEDSTTSVTISDVDSTSVTATDLSAVGAATTGTVTATNALAITGSVSEATAALVTDASKVVVTNATVTLNDADAASISATALSGIGAATGGTVTVTNAIAISGSQAEVTAALVTGSSKVDVSDAAVTINDADATSLTASALSAIGGSTTGTVTVTNAVDVSGTVAEMTAALITSGTKVDLSSGTATLDISGVGTTSNLSGFTMGGDLTANLSDGANISSNANLGTVDIFKLESGADVTMSIVQHNKISDALGSNTVTMSDNGSFTGISSIESYILANGVNNFTMASSTQSVTGGNGVDTISGGSGDNTITGGVGLDSLTGGGGADKFAFTSGDAFTDVNSSNVYETINDFVTGTDTIAIGAAIGNLRYSDGSAKFSSEFDDLANASFDGTGKDAYMLYNVSGFGDAIVAVDMDESGALNSGDLLIKFVGLDENTDLVSADFVI